MAELKIVVNDIKAGKSYAKTIEDGSELVGKKIGNKISGDLIGVNGYEFEVTGGSDKSGFPMRKDIEGTFRKRPLVTSGIGMAVTKRKGMKSRRTVTGNTIGNDTAQVNLKALSYGKETLAKLFGKEEAPAEEKKHE